MCVCVFPLFDVSVVFALFSDFSLGAVAGPARSGDAGAAQLELRKNDPSKRSTEHGKQYQ